MANRLAREKSLYLRQHANNPVDWFAWGDEAFAKAKAENKILLISIGYSTCHWCHVMEHESFESPDVANALNRDFVAIKVDREEKPDVDQFYMDALHAFSPRGGWPLNMFVTPDLKPFFGGTYFPQAGFLDLLARLQEAWREQPQAILEQAEKVVAHVTQGRVVDLDVPATPLARLREKRAGWLRAAAGQMLRNFDPVWGGFGAAPKFPRSHATSALLRHGLEADRAAVAHSLKAMAFGGLRDALRGGFHRYSTDEQWLVPHFEKMLYDQALLLKTYAEAYAVFREDFYADIVEETLEYLEAEMRLPNGGFAAAQDADSEGVEGKFFVWTREEVQGALEGESQELFARFAELHSITRDGNWHRHAAHGKHVPTGPVNVLALPLARAWSEWRDPEMARLRKRLLDLRSTRIAPVRDDKFLVAWNGWMASGLLEASIHLADRPALSVRLLEAGRRTVNFLTSLETDGRYPRVVYGTESRGEGFLEDHAAVAHALQMLGTRTGEPGAWAHARTLLDAMDRRFRDARGKLTPSATDVRNPLPAGGLEDSDNATPAAISQTIGAQLRQALVDSDPARTERALRDLAPFERALDSHPTVLTYLLCELDLLEGFCLKSDRVGSLIPELLGQGRFATGFALLEDASAKDPLVCDFESCRRWP